MALKSKRSVEIESLPLAPSAALKPNESRVLEVEVGYEVGGMNYFSGNSSPRGYYLRMTPIMREKGEHFTSKAFTLFSGKSAFLEPAKVFNAKKLAEVAAAAKSLPVYETLKAAVIAGNKLTLAAPAPPVAEPPAAAV